MSAIRIQAKLALMALAALLAFGCSGADGGSGNTDALAGDGFTLPDVELPLPGEATVDTIPVPTTVAVGEAVEVACPITPAKFDVLPTEVTFAGGAANDTEIDGHTVVFRAPGEYRLACRILGTDIVDESPATVTVQGAGPASVDTELSPNPATAGETVNVTCVARDAAGVEMQSDFELQVSPSSGFSISGLSATFTVAGDYEVACAVLNGAVDDSPVALTVAPGPLASVVTELSPETVAAGEPATVGCLATDEFGNAIEDLAFTIEADEGALVDGAAVSATLVGLYDVGCLLSGADDAGVAYEGAELQVLAGPAAELQLSPLPARAAYKKGAQVTIEATVLDAFGNVVPDVAVTEVTPEPEAAVTRLQGDVFRFVEEGFITFRASLVDDVQVSDELVLTCDGTGPAVVIDFPLRGATLDGPPVVNVTGQVVDAVTGVQSFTINGEAVTIDESGAFSHPVDAVHGMNLIATVAVDGAGQAARSWRSFYYSDLWYPVDQATPMAGLVPDGVQAFVHQQTLETTDPEWPADAVDAASLFSSLLADFDILSLIPRPAAVQQILWCEHRVYVEALSFDAPVVHLTAFGDGQSPGGIRLRAELPRIRGRVDVPASGLCISASADISADSIVLNATILLEIRNGQVVSEMRVGDVDVNGLDVDVDGALGFLTNWIINFFEDSLADMLVDEFVGTIEEEVTAILAEVANLMSINEAIEIPPLIGEGLPTVITIQTAPSLIEFTTAGMELRVEAAVLADRVVDRDPLGAIGRGSCTGGTVGLFELDRSHGVEIGAADDVLNQAAFSIWYGGALEIVLGAADIAELGADLSSYGITDLAAAIHLYAPPIVEGCANDGKLLLQVGDALLDASFGFMGQPVDLSMFLQVAIDASIVIVEGEEGVELGIQLGELQTLEAEVVAINEEQAGREETFANLIRTAVPPLLGDLADEPITFAIPSFDLSGLMEGLPGGLWLTLRPQVLGRDLGFTEAAGYLAEGTPEEPAPAE